MLKKIVLSAIVLLFGLSISAQPGQPERDKDLPYTNPKPMYLEAHLFEKDSGYVCFVSYKVSLSNLVFTKNNGDYHGGITLNVEALKENGNVVRSSTTDEIYVKNYSDTEARDLFLEGMLSMELDEYLFELNPLVGISNTAREFPLAPIRLEPETIEAQRPIVIKQIRTKCTPNAQYELLNFGNSIPYGPADADLLVPAPDSIIDTVYVKLAQNSIVIKRDTLTNPVPHAFYVVKCENNVYLSDSTKSAGEKKYFFMSSVSEGLREGNVTVSVYNADTLFSENELEVVWHYKPRSLFNPEYAYKLLKLIAEKDTLNAILDRNDENYFTALQEFWEGRNPEENSSYNPLEAEFYSRVDFAIKEYAVRSDRNPSLTDRGEIYVKYGKPSDIERVYSEKGDITEIWKYENLNMEFLFTDRSGLGNFRLHR